MTESTQLLPEILRLSQAMRTEGSRADWEKVRELEQSRRALIADCFPLPEEYDSPRAGDQIREIIDLSREVIEMAEQERLATSEAIGNLNKGRHASQAYLQAGKNR
jgi:hypothetical protein